MKNFLDYIDLYMSLFDFNKISKKVMAIKEITPSKIYLDTPNIHINTTPNQKYYTKIIRFNPQNFNQFIGQTKAKERIFTIINKIKQGFIGHILVDGIQGHGKTTFVRLFAKELKADLLEVIGSQLDIDNLSLYLNQINLSNNNYVIFFIDEIDTMDYKYIKLLNPVLEYFEINNKKIKPFIFAGATINKYKLIQKVPDTLDRIPHHIKFERYISDDIKIILKQYYYQIYPNSLLPENAINIISNNSKYNPRRAIAMLEDYIVEQDIQKVLNNYNIITEGLTLIDLKILKFLSQQPKPIGANALATKIGLSEKEYLTEYEPYLIEFDYIARIPSRKITDKGRQIVLDYGKYIR